MALPYKKEIYMSRLLNHYANLHTHSTHSDGFYAPDELVRIAKEIGYGAIALTDHDTVSGNPIMKRECERLGIEYVFGAEFYARLPEAGRIIHMTGYGFDPEYPPIKEHVRKMAEKYSTPTKLLFERAISLGEIKGVSWEEVLEYNKGINWLVYSHVFNTMKAKGLITMEERAALQERCFSTELKRSIPSMHDYADARELIRHVHDAGGIMLFAHPHGFLDYVKMLAKEGLDGLEVWHGELDASERREALTIARDYELYVSGGDDHSGLLGGQYYRFEHPEETRYFFPPLSLGTTQYFFEEIRDMKKKADRVDVINSLLADDSIWQRIR